MIDAYHLQQQYKEFQHEYELLSEKIQRLKIKHATEVDESIKFNLEKQLQGFEKERNSLVEKLESIEKELQERFQSEVLIAQNKSIAEEILSDEIYSLSLLTRQKYFSAIRGLLNEMEFNLKEIDRFLERGYKVIEDKIVDKENENVTFRYMTCMIKVFESNDIQETLPLIRDKVKEQFFSIYRGFREINDRAEALKQVFRTWRVVHYLETVEEFNKNIRPIAEYMIKNLLSEK